jgi:hypothetical protein
MHPHGAFRCLLSTVENYAKQSESGRRLYGPPFLFSNALSLIDLALPALTAIFLFFFSMWI